MAWHDRKTGSRPGGCGLLVLVALAFLVLHHHGRLARRLVVLAGRQLIHSLQHRPMARMPPLVAPMAAPDLDAALAALATIRVARPMTGGYRREDWPHWLDLGGTCRDTRQELLAAASRVAVTYSASGCTVIRGQWLDPYSGATFRDAAALDIDHVVPLEEAFGSGGFRWSRARRTAYANGVDDPRVLLVVSGTDNRAKGAKGPEDWLPPNVGYRCRYVADWVLIKARWHLRMDTRERSAVTDLLKACRAAG